MPPEGNFMLNPVNSCYLIPAGTLASAHSPARLLLFQTGVLPRMRALFISARDALLNLSFLSAPEDYETQAESKEWSTVLNNGWSERKKEKERARPRLKMQLSRDSSWLRYASSSSVSRHRVMLKHRGLLCKSTVVKVAYASALRLASMLTFEVGSVGFVVAQT